MRIASAPRWFCTRESKLSSFVRSASAISIGQPGRARRLSATRRRCGGAGRRHRPPSHRGRECRPSRRAEAPCFFPVPALLSPCYLSRLFGRKAIWIKAVAKRAGENARYQAKFAVPALSAPAENPDFRGPLRPVCCKSAAFAAKRPSPAEPTPGRSPGGHPPAQSAPARVQSGCKSAANAARHRPSPSRAMPGMDANPRHAMPRGLSRCQGVISCATGTRQPARCTGSRAPRSR